MTEEKGGLEVVLHGSLVKSELALNAYYEKLSEKDLDILELKKNFLQEISILKSIVQKKEAEILTTQNDLRKTSIALKEDSLAHAELKKKYAALKEKQQKVISESLGYKKSCDKKSSELNMQILSLNETITMKNQEIVSLKKHLRDAEGNFDRANRKVNELDAKNKEIERDLTAISEEKKKKWKAHIVELEARVKSAKDELESVKIKNQLLEERLKGEINANDRNEIMVNKLKLELEASFIKFNKLRADLDYHKMQSKANSISSNKERENEPHVANENNQSTENTKLKDQIVNMKRELNACVEHLKQVKAKAELNDNRLKFGDKQKFETRILELEKMVTELETYIAQMQIEKQEITDRFNGLLNEINETGNAESRKRESLESCFSSLVQIVVSLISSLFRYNGLNFHFDNLMCERENLKSLISMLLNGQEPSVDLLLEDSPNDNLLLSGDSDENKVSSEEDLIPLVARWLASLFGLTLSDSNTSLSSLLSSRNLDTNIRLDELYKECNIFQGRNQTDKDLQPIEKADALLNELKEIRSMIATKYADSLGSDCITQ